ncbi:hypothetical protein OFC55_43690, partial [Escherichia coli]|nr:hypothetical protein [Escherichia coli]
PSVMDTLRARMWAVDAAAGTLVATTASACDGTGASILGVSPSGWADRVAVSATLRVTARLSASGAATVAGVVLRLV